MCVWGGAHARTHTYICTYMGVYIIACVCINGVNGVLLLQHYIWESIFLLDVNLMSMLNSCFDVVCELFQNSNVCQYIIFAE